MGSFGGDVGGLVWRSRRRASASVSGSVGSSRPAAAGLQAGGGAGLRNEGWEARDGSSSSPCRGHGLRHAGRRPRPCSHFLSVPFDSWVLSPPVIHPLICANPPCSREDTGQVEGERAAPGRRRKATAPHSCSLPERNKGRGTSQVEEPDPSSLALHVSGSTVAGGRTPWHAFDDHRAARESTSGP